MQITLRFKKQSGTILITALWLLALLTFFAVELGFGLRQKIALTSRLEKNEQLHFLAESGVNKAIAILNEELEKGDYIYSLKAKQRWHNNPDDFKEINLVSGVCDVSYSSLDGRDARVNQRYGFVDEASKMNINMANLDELKVLLQQVLAFDEGQAEELAQNILEWEGRFSFPEEQKSGKTYYASLKHPYSLRSAPLVVIDELKLVKGMDEEKFKKLLPFVTIYEHRAVNINTASEYVLNAIGISEGLRDKILRLRRGGDGIDGTKDDFIFAEVETIPQDLEQSLDLSDDEYNEVMVLVNAQKIRINSRFFAIQSTSRFMNSTFQKQVFCVYDSAEKKNVYWREI